MWSGRGEGGADGARQPVICLDSLGRAKASASRTRSARRVPSATTAKFTIGEHAKVLHRGRREVEPGSGEIGMLAVGGHIPVGYYKDEAKSAATFRDDRRRRAGRCRATSRRVEADGTIVLLGRGSVCINSGGEKVYPEEVEEAVKLHPAVADCLVVGVPDERFGEAVTAVVAADARATVDDARRASSGALERPRALQAPAPLRVRRRGAARPERQGRLRVGQGRPPRQQRSADADRRRAPSARRATAAAAVSARPRGAARNACIRVGATSCLLPACRPWRARRGR